nr:MULTISPECIES: hypothetical protein [Flavobacterium]
MYSRKIISNLQLAKRSKSIFNYSLLLIALCLFSQTANAQCAMCRAALTSEGNTTKAAAVNDGIVYLMVIPYLLVAGIGYAIYRMKKKKS